MHFQVGFYSYLLLLIHVVDVFWSGEGTTWHTGLVRYQSAMTLESLPKAVDVSSSPTHAGFFTGRKWPDCSGLTGPI